ncbi:ABC transporter substrate-binding protein [Candidatus Chloroploca sp. Khr17]|uniref:ABC transporter substrate-binding protein n=1 Tax=Candidatus Chloroploca sp. Khr17 TaxID=2496869 RepID=UPI00101B64C3|nr:ABC transporter substrate-binding protein [Candidatus Chloroploca sp. Khr17]
MRTFRVVLSLVVLLVLVACGSAPVAAPTAAPTDAPVAEQPATTVPEATIAPTEVPTQEPQVQPTGPVRGGFVTRALTTEPTGLDPAGAQGSGQNVVLPYLFDTLVAADVTNTTQPLLAESWEVSEDALSIVFTLREGITFHDGTPLDAAAVVYSFERLRAPDSTSPMAASLQSVAAIEAVDARTVRFDFSEPSAVFFATITSPYASIVSPTAVEALGEGFAQQPVGSGPFKLKEWNQGIAITLERNEDYAWAPPMVTNEGAPYLDGAIFKVVPDASTQLTALQAGEVDLIFLNLPDQIARLRQDTTINLLPLTLNSLTYMGFNMVRAPFDDLLVRQAVAHAIDKDVIVQAAAGGEGTPAFAPMAVTLPGFDPSLQSGELAYDPEATATLLTEAGFVQESDGSWSKDGTPLALTLLTFTRAPNQDIATVIQAQLQDVGIPVEIQQLDAPAAGRQAVEGQYDLLLWRYDWNDPDVLNINLSSSRIGSTNRVAYSNPEVDALLDAASRELDPAARAQIYVEAQRLIMADAPWQPLYTPVDMLAVHGRVNNVVLSAMGRVLLNDATVEE